VFDPMNVESEPVATRDATGATGSTLATFPVPSSEDALQAAVAIAKSAIRR